MHKSINCTGTAMVRIPVTLARWNVWTTRKYAQRWYMLGMPGSQPCLGGMYQRCAYFRVVHTFHRAKVTGIRTIAVPVQLIDLCTDPSYRLIIPVRDPSLPFSVLEKWIEPGKMQPPFQT